MTKRDYYEILGVSQSADDQTLKSAYRRMALKYHPDRNPGSGEAEEKFKEAAEAYSVLTDPQKRAAYDRFGHQGLGAQGTAGWDFDPSVFADFNDILGDFFGFGDIFGGGRTQRRSRAQRGADVRYDLEISFEDAIRGMSAEILVPQLEECSHCNGKGGEPDGGIITCTTCHGRGEVIRQQSFLSIRTTCPSCRGNGHLIRRPCSECNGDGQIRIERKLKINVPAGVDNGTHLRLSHEGRPGYQGGPPGDLYVVLKVKDHPIFERQENNIHCTIPLSVVQAALGTQLEVPTLDGVATLHIPPGTQHGAQFHLRGYGAPSVGGRSKGDLCVHVEVKIPTKLSKEQKKLFEELGETLPTENQPREKGLFDKVKDYFA